MKYSLETLHYLPYFRKQNMLIHIHASSRFILIMIGQVLKIKEKTSGINQKMDFKLQVYNFVCMPNFQVPKPISTKVVVTFYLILRNEFQPFPAKTRPLIA